MSENEQSPVADSSITSTKVEPVASEPPASLSWPGFRDWLAALPVIFLAAVCLFYPQFSQPNSLLVGIQKGGENDFTSYFLAARLFPSKSLEQNGQIPLWNPHELMGHTWFSQPQSAMLYPPNWLFYLFPNPVFGSWFQVAHLVWAALGMWLLGRLYGWPQLAALTGAVLLMGAPYYMAQLLEGHLNQICVVAWYPWAFIAWERVKAGRPFAVGILALVLLMSLLAGHQQEVYYLGMILSLAAVQEAVRLKRANQAFGAPLLKWTAAVVLTSGLFCVQLIPTLFFASQSVRMKEMEPEVISVGSFSSASLRQLVPAVRLW